MTRIGSLPLGYDCYCHSLKHAVLKARLIAPLSRIPANGGATRKPEKSVRGNFTTCTWRLTSNTTLYCVITAVFKGLPPQEKKFQGASMFTAPFSRLIAARLVFPPRNYVSLRHTFCYGTFDLLWNVY